MKVAGTPVGLLIEALIARTDVTVITLFGSQARSVGNFLADEQSDVDLQVVVKDPGKLVDPSWARAHLAGNAIKAWNVKNAFGGVQKVSVVLTEGELDLVVVPAKRMRWAYWAMRLDIHRRSPQLRRKFGDLVLVMGNGYRVLKGGEAWELFWQKLLREVPEPRMTQDEVRNIVEGVKVDHVSIQQKLQRGELIAAQRWLHTGIAEANFKLLHELRRRRGETSFHDGRRAELLWQADWVDSMRISARCEAAEIAAAAEQGLRMTNRLAAELAQTSA